MRRSNARTRVDFKPDDDDNNNDNDNMDPIKLHIRPGTRSNLFFRSSSKHTTKSRLLILGSLSVAFAFLFCYLFLSSRNSRTAVKTKYGIVIDGGSTGTRIHVFRFRVEGGNHVVDFGKENLASMRLNPGLSRYADDPELAGRSLAELLEFGKIRVPKEKWGSTEIRLMATAGMRLLESEVQEQILEACRRVLRSSGFKFKDEWASVITGSDEGIFAWVVANYALGTLGSDPLETTGIIELGGASAQVTFVSSEPMPPQFSHTVEVGNVTYNLYSHSLIHFGQNAAHDSLREVLVSGEFSSATESLQKGIVIDPCTPTGYSHNAESWKLSPHSLGESNILSIHSKGNFSECRSAALSMLQKGKEKCSFQYCNIGSTFIPKLRGKFLATENFFHTSEFFGLGMGAFLSHLVVAGQEFCGEDWSKLKRRYSPHNEEDLLRYCFSSAYIVSLLHDSLGIGLDDESIHVANHVKDIPLDWALGAFVLQSASDESTDQSNNYWIANILSHGSPTMLSLIFITILLVFIARSISKWRKPQVKTIYDLEKGRYIVTRVCKS